MKERLYDQGALFTPGHQSRKHYMHQKISPMLATFSITALLLLAFLSPPEALPNQQYMPHLDKAVHLISFLGLTLLLSSLTSAKSYTVAGLCVVIGILIELIQPYFGRGFDQSDIIADMIGVGIGILASKAFGVLMPETTS